MKNKLFAAVLCVSLVPGAFAAVTFDQKGSVTALVEQLKDAGAAGVVPLPGNPKAAKNWTVMVYVNAKNNLEQFGLGDVNEMEMVGSDDSVNIVAELGRISGYSSADGDWTGSRRYLIQKDADTSKITSPVVMEIPKSDMGSWQSLAEFTRWSMKNYPARHYALIVWNHGAGWNKDVSFAANKGISYDDESGNHITTPQLRQALEAIGKIDIFGMDACLMQMVEVGYEIRKQADFIVASEETEPGDGYTYNTWLAPLAANPAMTGEELAKAMVNSYTDHYQAINQGATQSALRTASLEKYAALSNDWAGAVMAAGDLAAVKNARSKAQAFYYSSNKDAYHFVKLVSEASANADVAAKGKALMAFIKDDLVVLNRATGAKYANANGLAVYVPTSYTSAYDSLLWSADSNWDDFTRWIK